MHHIDEHTLELYTLKAEEVAERVDEIEAHLEECHGCRALVEEMRG
jgi:predicted anti-sigma-YlaC factor YlaD